MKAISRFLTVILSILIVVLLLVDKQFIFLGAALIYYSYTKHGLKYKLLIEPLIILFGYFVIDFYKDNRINFLPPLYFLAISALIVYLSEFLLKRQIESENRIVQQILHIIGDKNNEGNVNVTMSINDVARQIIAILRKYYKHDYCTIFLKGRRGYKAIASNVDAAYISSIEQTAKSLSEEIAQKRLAGKIISAPSDNSLLTYPSAERRKIKYALFVPLETGLANSSALFIENRSVYNFEGREEIVFKDILNSISLVMQNAIYHDKIMALATTDGLTGLYNRKYLDERLAREIEIHKSFGRSFVFAILDIDHFKKFNDTYGHLFGDKVLSTVSEYIANNIRECDIAARYGGEEMCVIFTDTSVKEIFARVDQLREGISELELITENNEIAKVTASFGLSQYPNDGADASSVIKAADEALYYSKKNGRNRVTAFNKIADLNA